MGQRNQDYVLSGIIELDDAYFGAPKSNGKRGGGRRKPAHWPQCPSQSKGIPAWVDFWGNDCTHDWYWWYKQVLYFLPYLLD